MVNEGISLVVSNWLFIALLAVTFFFGDLIYDWVKNNTNGKTNAKLGDFFLALILIVILSVLPLIVSQLMMQFFSIRFNIFIVIVLFIVSFWKYYSRLQRLKASKIRKPLN